MNATETEQTIADALFELNVAIFICRKHDAAWVTYFDHSKMGH